MNTPNVTAMCLDSFVQMEGQFLSSLMEVFPECPNLRQVKLELNMATTIPAQKQALVEDWIQYIPQLKRAAAVSATSEPLIV